MAMRFNVFVGNIYIKEIGIEEIEGFNTLFEESLEVDRFIREKDTWNVFLRTGSKDGKADWISLGIYQSPHPLRLKRDIIMSLNLRPVSWWVKEKFGPKKGKS